MAINSMLIAKEFSVLKKPLLCYGALSILAIAIMSLPSKTAGHIGTILQITVMIAFYCHTAIKSVIGEAKDKCATLWLGLPTTPRKIQLTKLLSLWLIFFSIWLPSLLLTLTIIGNNPYWPAVAIAFYIFGFSLYLPAFALMLTAAFTTRSEGITIFVLVCSNLAVTVMFNLIPNSEVMQQAYAAGMIQEAGYIWPPLLLQLTGTAVCMCLALVIITLASLFRQQEIRI